MTTRDLTSKKLKISQNQDEAAEWLLKPLRLELKLGCNNTAVAGGLELWIPRVRERLETQAGLSAHESARLLAPLEGYAQAAAPERVHKIHCVLGLPSVPLAHSPLPAPITPAKPDSTAPAAGRCLSPLDEVQYLKGVGPNKARLLKKLEIETAAQLLRHYPREWQDRSRILPIGHVKSGETAVICGVVRSRGVVNIRRGLTLAKVVLDDSSARIEAAWFNQAYMAERFAEGQRVLLSGKVDFFRNFQIRNPEFEILEDAAEDTVHMGRLVPVYPLTEGLSQRVLRTLLYGAVNRVGEDWPDALPAPLRQAQDLWPASQALRQVHFPDSPTALEQARKRLIFEELFLQQMAVLRLKKNYQAATSAPLPGNGPLQAAFAAQLPFALTAAQARAQAEILVDISQARPMHRLLQGDVGSGKTVVAVSAMLAAADAGMQAALMAPTEVLAGQHFLTLKQWLEPLGVRVELVTSAVKPALRRQLHEDLAMGLIPMVVGTHALTQEHVNFKNLGLAVIDEQHRFGVEQRARLRAKGKQPHVLVMTATPIPRTLAMTAYGDLDVTTLDEMPPGRMPVKTEWLRRKYLGRAFETVRRELEAGRQAYIIFPLIEESEKSDLRALEKEYELLTRDVFPGIELGLLHGRMATAEKEGVMADFKANRTRVLASTTVVEVGVDVPNATVMVIENAERFGLAQLHQLRGRVGRGRHPGRCFLISDAFAEEARQRMEIMTKVSNGFRLAEEDLALRGPGEFFGLRQHGLPDLKLASLVRDAGQIEPAREAARAVLEADPGLCAPEHRGLRQAYGLLYAEREQHARTG